MGRSRLAKQCQECRFVGSCSHKRMEAMAFFSEVEHPESVLTPYSRGLRREVINLNIDGDVTPMYKDEIADMLRKNLSVNRLLEERMNGQ